MKVYFVGWDSDYDQIMIHTLSHRFDVEVVNIPESLTFRRVNRRLNFNLTRMYVFLRLLFSPKNSVLVLKDTNTYKYIESVSNVKMKKILVLRNVVNEIFINKFRPGFDKIYSFDEGQCNEFNLKYIPQFMPACLTKESSESNRKEAIFIGKDKGRAGFLFQLSKILDKCNIASNFHVLRDESSSEDYLFYKDKALKYEQVIKLTKGCSVIVEINKEKQVGITLRALEALFLNKKLISNNVNLKDYDFFHPSRIYIIDDIKSLKEQDLIKFLDGVMEDVIDDIKEKYTVESFFKKLLSNE